MFARHNIAIGKLWLSAQDMNMFKSFKIKEDAGARRLYPCKGLFAVWSWWRRGLPIFFSGVATSKLLLLQ